MLPMWRNSWKKKEKHPSSDKTYKMYMTDDHVNLKITSVPVRMHS